LVFVSAADGATWAVLIRSTRYANAAVPFGEAKEYSSPSWKAAPPEAT